MVFVREDIDVPFCELTVIVYIPGLAYETEGLSTFDVAGLPPGKLQV